MNNSLAHATDEILKILEPLTPDDRQRVAKAAFILLGDAHAPDLDKTDARSAPEEGDSQYGNLNSQAVSWLKKKALRVEQLEHYFHFDGGRVTVIALPEGPSSIKDKTEASYLMLGLAEFLATGNAAFKDESARSLCEHLGCYSISNHSTYIKDFGNKLTGDKSNGWKLTAPGLDAAATLIKKAAPNG
jgi:hypothetical protein